MVRERCDNGPRTALGWLVHESCDDVSAEGFVLLAVESELCSASFLDELLLLLGSEVIECFVRVCEACSLCPFFVGNGCGAFMLGHHVEACFAGAVRLGEGFGDESVVSGTADGSGDRGNAFGKLY